MLSQPIKHELKDFGLFQLVVDLVIQAIPNLKGSFTSSFLGEFLAGVGGRDGVSRAMHKQ